VSLLPKLCTQESCCRYIKPGRFLLSKPESQADMAVLDGGSADVNYNMNFGDIQLDTTTKTMLLVLYGWSAEAIKAN
jgi:hypothetical protein